MMRCKFHDETAVCDRCPERFTTDGKGFPHPAERKGRQALRVCRGCARAVPVERWNVDNFFHCLECTPGSTGQVSAVPRETIPPDLAAAARRISLALHATNDAAARKFLDEGLAKTREWAAEIGLDLDAEHAKAEAERALLVAIFEAALVVGRHWNDQDGVNAQHIDTLAELVRQYDKSRTL